MDKIKTTQRLHIWLEMEEGMFIGLGRIQLLERIEKLGSLNKAAASMGMSYRAAWGRMKKTEALLGSPLVAKAGPRNEFRLTDLGREIVQQFRKWQSDVESYALKSARSLFPWAVQAFIADNYERD